tara:strand:+ start:587 stop:772 length:186 start_codon:yes stop_codon:yes gene_type:complete
MNTNRPILLAGLMVIALIVAVVTQLKKEEPEHQETAPSSNGDSGMNEAEQEKLMRKIGYVM